MEKWLLQYQTLSPEGQKEVTDFVEFVAAKAKKNKSSSLKNWKRRLLNVSVWSPKDIKVLKKNTLKSWKPKEW
jgi:hypothetical protein